MPRLLASLCCTLVFLAAATSVQSAAAAPLRAPDALAQADLYAPPAPMVPGEPGSVVWWQPMPSSDPANLSTTRPTGASAARVIYRSIAVDGTPNVNSATVFTPTGPPPAGGWRVVAWNHVTTGGADLCAPSRATPLLPGTQRRNPEWERLTRSDEVIAGLLRREFVVARTDFEGIGTPGPHPYLVGRSLARSTVDAVRAARELVSQASTEWAVAGQSEGGIASWATSSMAAQLAPELKLRATLVATPPIDNRRMVFQLGALLPYGGNLSALAALMLHGAAVADPQIAADVSAGRLIGGRPAARMPEIDSLCLEQLGGSRSLGAFPIATMFARSTAAARERFYAELDRNDPRAMPLGPEPVRVYAAGVDLAGWQPMITKVVRAERLRGSQVSYRTYPLATHITIADNAQAGVDMANWIASMLR